MDAEERLARLLCGAAGKVNWTAAIPAVYRDQARHVLASDWYAGLAAAEARAEAAERKVAALERLSNQPARAMDLWWTTTGDDWPVPDAVPGRFLRAALDTDPEEES